MNLSWRKQIVLITLSIGVIFAATNCDKNPADPDEMLTDVSAIETLVANDPDIFHEMGIDDNGAQSPSYSGSSIPKATDEINTIRFGRRGYNHLISIDIDFFGPPEGPDTMAIATITRSFDGKFIAVEKDTNQSTPEDFIIYEKDMVNGIVRKAKFRRINFTNNPLNNWKLVEVSMAEGQSDPTTISFDEVTIEAPNMEPIIITSPLDYFMNRREGIPTFSPGDTVKVYTTLNNINNYPPEPGTTLLLHFGVDRWMRRARRPFNDAGFYPDQIAGDGIFSGFWVAQHRPGIYHAVVDAIDNGTIYDDVAPYNSYGWGTVYKIE